MAKADGGLRKIFQDHLKGIHWQPIESMATGNGIPDSNGCREGAEFWCEFKTTDAWAVDLSVEQVSWIDRRYRAGGRVWIAVRQRHNGGPRKGKAVDDLWLFFGDVVRGLKLHGLKIHQSHVTAHYIGGPTQWDWRRVQLLLTGGIPPLP